MSLLISISSLCWNNWQLELSLSKRQSWRMKTDLQICLGMLDEKCGKLIIIKSNSSLCQILCIQLVFRNEKASQKICISSWKETNRLKVEKNWHPLVCRLVKHFTSKTYICVFNQKFHRIKKWIYIETHESFRVIWTIIPKCFETICN